MWNRQGTGLLPALSASALFNFPFIIMCNRFKYLICGTAALFGVITLSEAQIGSPTPASPPLTTGTLQSAPAANPQATPAIAPAPPTATRENSPLTVVQSTNAPGSPAAA